MPTNASALIALLVLVSSVPAFGASFDCGKSRTPSEHLICSDEELSRRDDDLAVLYKRARAAAPDRAAFDQSNRKEWRRRESTCVDKACLLSWYNNRTQQLNQVLGSAQPAGVAAAPDPAPVPVPQPTDITSTYSDAARTCRVQNELGQHDCYEEVLKRYRGSPQSLLSVDVRDAVAYCDYVGESNDSDFCANLRAEHQDLFDAETLASHQRSMREKQRLADEESRKPKVLQVLATGVSVVPGAVICPDEDRVQMMFQLYVSHYQDVMQDKLSNGQARLLHGSPSDPPDPSDYGCALVATGTLMTLERGNIVPVVSVKQPDGTTVRGVTLPAMIQGCYARKCW